MVDMWGRAAASVIWAAIGPGFVAPCQYERRLMEYERL